jgi:hypothetical protein
LCHIQVCFFTHTELNARAVHLELGSVYQKEALTLLTAFKRCPRFWDGRTDVSDEPSSGTRQKSDLATAISSMLEEHFFLLCQRILHEDLAL